MGVHWTQKRRAVAAIGSTLREKGWRLYGWKDDHSDPMTDYFDPESWRGVATKWEGEEYVVCVDVSSYDVQHCSGGVKLIRSIEDGDCPRCKGTGAEPEGWTIEQAREDPKEFNRQRTQRISPGGSLLLSSFPEVDSRSFTDSGEEKCVRCYGRKKVFRSEEYVEPWPTFQANPRGATWHVERDGRIIAKGTGVYSILGGGYDPDPEKLAHLIARIEEAVAPKQAKMLENPASGPVSVEHDRDWTWIRFAEKPAEVVREKLKGIGARWSRRREAWYITRPVEAAEVLNLVA